MDVRPDMHHRTVTPDDLGTGGGGPEAGGRSAAAPTDDVAVDLRKRERRRQRTVAGLALGALITAVTALALLVWGAYQWRLILDRENALSSEDEGSTRRTGLSAEVEAEEAAAEEGNDEPPIDVPAKTEVREEGGITVVDIGLDAPRLDAALAEQVRIAERSRHTLLVMLTGRRCTPCRGMDAALTDPRMQQALDGVRLVRIDLEVFAEELRRLRLPTNLYPAFFLLGSDLRPIDAIHGGEWDEDVPANIAPVLGAFVKGRYDERRHYDWSPTTTSIPL